MMTNWQEWAVLIILLGCLCFILYKLILFFRGIRKKENPCAGCTSDCALKHQLKNKPTNCTEKSNTQNKKHY